TSAAKIFGLFPRKGTIAVGSDADIVIFDPNEEMTISAKTHHMNVDYSCYEGTKVRGVTKTVLSRGDVVIDEGKYVAKPGRGEFRREDRDHSRCASRAHAEIHRSSRTRRRADPLHAGNLHRSLFLR